jgi:hypothetical protein
VTALGVSYYVSRYIVSMNYFRGSLWVWPDAGQHGVPLANWLPRGFFYNPYPHLRVRRVQYGFDRSPRVEVLRCSDGGLSGTGRNLCIGP